MRATKAVVARQGDKVLTYVSETLSMAKGIEQKLVVHLKKDFAENIWFNKRK